MSEDPTRNLSELSFQERVLSELAAIRAEQTMIRNDIATFDARLTAIEEKVDRRLQETRPIWEAVQDQIRQLDTKFDLVIKDLYEIRSDQVYLTRRVDQLERRPMQ